MALNTGEYVDPSLREAVNNAATAQLQIDSDADAAINKGLLKIEAPPRFSSGSAQGEAVMKRARERLGINDETNAGLQKLRYVQNQAQKTQNMVGNVMGLYKLDKQAENILRERKAKEDAQRAQVVASVLGVAGAVVGGFFGGPAGAAGGAQGGQALGGAFNAQNQSSNSSGTGYLGANTNYSK